MSVFYSAFNFILQFLIVIFIIRIESKIRSDKVSFPIFWNMPTFQCSPHKIYFSDMAYKYGIIQNKGDNFIGDNITILYDRGVFPAILPSNDSKKTILRNGGTPQKGNLSFHLTIFKENVEYLIKNKNFNGLGVIDFEDWRPIFRQNFGTLKPYKELSISELKTVYPLFPIKFIENEAARIFEYAAEIFMKETLLLAKKLRPKATWGYYHFPYCFNLSPANKKTNCPPEVSDENTKINHWLYENLDNFYPSIYLSEKRLNVTDRIRLIIGRINESHRINGLKEKTKKLSKIYPYFSLKYQDTNNFLNKENLREVFNVLNILKIDGLILWGSSKYVNSKKNCEELHKYIDTVLGPILTEPRINYEHDEEMIRNCEHNRTKSSFYYFLLFASLLYII